MKTIAYIIEKTESLKNLEAYIDLHQYNVDLMALLDWVTSQLEEEPIKLRRASEVAWYYTYSGDFLNKNAYSENQLMNLYNAIVQLILEIDTVLIENKLSLAEYRISFVKTTDRGIVLSLGKYDET